MAGWRTESSNGGWVAGVVAVLGLLAAIGGIGTGPADAAVTPSAAPPGVAGPTFPVNVTETYLPAGANWTLTIGSQSWSASRPWIVIQEPNGTYAYNISVPGNPSIAPSHGSFTVNGAAITVEVNSPGGATGGPAASTAGSGGTGASLVYGLAAIAAFVLAAALLVSGRARARDAASQTSSQDTSRAEGPGSSPPGPPPQEATDPLSHML